MPRKGGSKGTKGSGGMPPKSMPPKGMGMGKGMKKGMKK